MSAGGLVALHARILSGWLAAAGLVEIFWGDDLLGSVLARPQAGRAVFEFLLPENLEGEAQKMLRARQSEVWLVPDTDFQQAAAPVGKAVGSLDLVSEEGMAQGWAWLPENPAARLEIELLADGVPAGVTTAGLYRADVAAAGAGDGFYGFSWPLPYTVLALPRDVEIAARVKATAELLPHPRILAKKFVADALTRLDALEDDLRLLHASLAQARCENAEQAARAAEMFATAGGFFEAFAAGKPLGQFRPLHAALAGLAQNLAPLDLPAGAAPACAIFLPAAGDAETVHAGLAALGHVFAHENMEFWLLDDGTGAEAALLPLIIRPLRYLHLRQANPIARLNAAMRAMRGNVAIFTHSPAGPAEPRALLAAFERDPLLGLALSQNIDDAARADAGLLTFGLNKAVWARLGGFDEGSPSLALALEQFMARAETLGFHIYGSVSIRTRTKI